MAEIIDLGTAGAAGGGTLARRGTAVSGFFDPSGYEFMHEAGKRLRHLVGKRHHAS